MLELALEAQV